MLLYVALMTTASSTALWSWWLLSGRQTPAWQGSIILLSQTLSATQPHVSSVEASHVSVRRVSYHLVLRSVRNFSFTGSSINSSVGEGVPSLVWCVWSSVTMDDDDDCLVVSEERRRDDSEARNNSNRGDILFGWCRPNWYYLRYRAQMLVLPQPQASRCTRQYWCDAAMGQRKGGRAQ